MATDAGTGTANEPLILLCHKAEEALTTVSWQCFQIWTSGSSPRARVELPDVEVLPGWRTSGKLAHSHSDAQFQSREAVATVASRNRCKALLAVVGWHNARSAIVAPDPAGRHRPAPRRAPRLRQDRRR